MNSEIKDILYEIFDYKDFQFSTKIGNVTIYKFTQNNKKYEVYFNRINNKNYHISFALLDKNGVPVYNLLKNIKEVIKILSNVQHITLEFLKITKVNGIVFESRNRERDSLYLKFANFLSDTYKYDLTTKSLLSKNREKSKVFFLTKNGADLSHYESNEFMSTIKQYIHDKTNDTSL